MRTTHPVSTKLLAFALIALLGLTGFVACTAEDSPLDATSSDPTADSRRAGYGLDPTETSEFDEDPPDWHQFLADIDATIYPNRQAVADSFITMLEDMDDYGFPLVIDTMAVYLYTGSGSIGVPGDHNGWDPGDGDAQMTTIAGTDLHYLETLYERDARLDYKFVINGSDWILDPRNPRTVSGGYGPNSELAMPDYVDPPEIENYPEIPDGMWDTFSFTSTIMNRTYPVAVYLPVGHDGGDEHYPAIYVHDGGEYRSLGSIGNVLDYCIHHQQIEPVIAVCVTPTNRNDEYWLNVDFKDMFVEELVPHIDASYRTLDEAASRAVMGASLGGVTSAYFAHTHPDVFGYAGGHSSAVWIDDGAFIDQVAADEPTDVVYYLDAGTYEPSIYTSSEDLKDVLLGKGNVVTWKVWHEGHSWGAWRAHTDDILIAFFAANRVLE